MRIYIYKIYVYTHEKTKRYYFMNLKNAELIYESAPPYARLLYTGIHLYGEIKFFDIYF